MKIKKNSVTKAEKNVFSIPLLTNLLSGMLSIEKVLGIFSQQKW